MAASTWGQEGCREQSRQVTCTGREVVPGGRGGSKDSDVMCPKWTQKRHGWPLATLAPRWPQGKGWQGHRVPGADGSGLSRLPA